MIKVYVKLKLFTLAKNSYLLDLSYASKEDIQPKSLPEPTSLKSNLSVPSISQNVKSFPMFDIRSQMKPTSENIMFLDVCSDIVFLLTSQR